MDQPGGALALELTSSKNETRLALNNVSMTTGSLSFNRPDQSFTSGPISFAVPGVAVLTAATETVLDLDSTKLDIAQFKIRQASEELRIESIGATTKAAKFAMGPSTAPKIDIQALGVETGGVSGRLTNAKGDTLTIKSLAIGVGAVSVALNDAGPDGALDGATARLDSGALIDPRTTNELARLARAEISGGSIRLGERAASIDRLVLDDGYAVANIDASGGLNWDPLVTALHGPAPTPPQLAKPAPAPAGGTWKALAKSVELRNLGAALPDLREQPAITLTFHDVNARARNLSSDGKQFAQVDLGGRLKEGGVFRTNGRVNPTTLETDLKLKISDLALTSAQPFITPRARLKIVSALSAADGRLRYGQPKAAGAGLVFEGDVELAKVQIDETELTKPFLAVDALTAAQLKLTLTPNQLDIPELRVRGLATKLLIAEDQSVNIAKVLRDKAPATKPSSDPPKPPATAPGDPFPISVSRVRVDDSRLEFSDLSLRPQFATLMHELKGVVTGISTSRDSRAQLELDARVDEFDSARIRGEINLFRPRTYTDVDMVFRNLGMTALTPYSAKFAGYRIASGRLSMDLQYKIKDSAPQGENRLVLDKLELGERVEGPTAFNLPLEFAIAILRDADGKIDLGVPVSGSLNDPQFSYGAIVWKAIGNIITRIVTTPFRALASLSGGGSEKLDAIDFDPGQERPQPPERQKLRTVSEALAKRPHLRLTVKPAYSAAADRPVLQSIAVRRDVYTRAGIKLEPGEAPGPIDFNQPRAQQAIQAAFQARFGAPALRDLRAGIAKPDAIAGAQGPKPHAPLPDQIYRVMTERLIEAHPVTETELLELAARRGDAVLKELIDVGKTDATRITAVGPQEASIESAKVVSVGLELGVTK